MFSVDKETNIKLLLLKWKFKMLWILKIKTESVKVAAAACVCVCLWSSGNNTQRCIYIFHGLSIVCLFIALIPTLSSSLILTTTPVLRTNKWKGLISVSAAKHHRLTFTAQGSGRSGRAPEGRGAGAQCLPTGRRLIDLIYQHRARVLTFISKARAEINSQWEIQILTLRHPWF